MRSNFTRTLKQTWATTLWILSLGLAACAAEPRTASPNTDSAIEQAACDLAWVELTPIAQGAPVRIWSVGERTNATYAITHGMGGTAEGDRFNQLAVAIHKSFPDARLLRIDWSELASAKIGNFPNPWRVAGSIDAVGDQVALVLKKEGLDPTRTTFIGESFGNWVNARIAYQLGGVDGILALNPANEGAGYALPDLRKHARRSWSFHTYSVFDTTLEIADSDFWLDTPAGGGHVSQHVAGIRWLTARIEAGDHTWLSMDKILPQRQAGHFRAMATMDGQLSDQQPSRERPVPVKKSDRPSAPGVTVATK